MNESDFHRPKSPLEPLKRIGRELGLDKAYDSVWRTPLRELWTLVNDGGPIGRRNTEAGHVAMREAAKTLPQISAPNLDRGARVHVLTGERFWHQSVYCVASLQLASDEKITPIFYSDGTLDERVKSNLQRVLPWAEFVDAAAIDASLSDVLPESRYPSLRARRMEYVHLRKLTDIHIRAGNWKLVLDSDLLFFRTPTSVLEWFQQPHPICMRDIRDSYGYPLDYLEKLAGGPLPSRFNVGLYGLDSSTIDWPRVEYWCARQLADFGASYLQEQGLTAMLMAGVQVTVLPEADYVLMPSVSEGRRRQAVMHHYVDRSKRSYFQHGWRTIDTRIREKRPLS